MNIYRIIKTWDDEIADWACRLQINNQDGEGWQDTVYTGDGAWAIDQVEHYQCGIVKIDEYGKHSSAKE